jgi:hypothetical protein
MESGSLAVNWRSRNNGFEADEQLSHAWEKRTALVGSGHLKEFRENKVIAEIREKAAVTSDRNEALKAQIAALVDAL